MTSLRSQLKLTYYIEIAALVHFFAIGYVRGRFDVRGNWVNGVFAAFAIGSVLLEPIFGHLSERKFNCRNLLLISNIFFILGNIIFSIDTSIGLLIFGRLIAGQKCLQTCGF